MVVIAGIKRNTVKRARGGYTTQDIERAVAIERRDLDGDDIVDSREAPPEIGAEDDTADRWLQIKSDQRNFARHRLAMGDDFILGGGFHRGETEQPRMIADAERDLCLANGLLGLAGEDHAQ